MLSVTCTCRTNGVTHKLNDVAFSVSHLRTKTKFIVHRQRIHVLQKIFCDLGCGVYYGINCTLHIAFLHIFKENYVRLVSMSSHAPVDTDDRTNHHYANPSCTYDDDMRPGPPPPSSNQHYVGAATVQPKIASTSTKVRVSTTSV